MTSHSTHQGAVRAAKQELGAEAIFGVDFDVTMDGSTFTWATIHQDAKAPAPVEAQASETPLQDRREAAKVSVAAKRKAKATKPKVKAARPAKDAKKPKAPKAAKAKAAPKDSKRSLVLGLLQRTQGATTEEIAAATSWLPHTIRAFVSTVPKKEGLEVTSEKADGVRTYRAAAAPA
jgi:hypothetical protein